MSTREEPASGDDAGAAADTDADTPAADHGLGDLSSGSDIERTVFFSDAVFAIAITLLVLELKPPETSNLHEFNHGLIEMIPAFMSFVLSFLLLAQAWMLHHRRFRAIVRYDARLQIWNFAVLFCVAMMPFPTSMVFTNHVASPIPPALYALDLSMLYLTMNGLWRHARINGQLSPDLPMSRYVHAVQAIRPVWIVFLGSIPFAFIPGFADRTPFLWILIMPVSMINMRLIKRHESARTAHQS